MLEHSHHLLRGSIGQSLGSESLVGTKKPAHPGKRIARAAGSTLSYSFPPPRNALRPSGLASDHAQSRLDDGGG
jgi:hypothetical protein